MSLKNLSLLIQNAPKKALLFLIRAYQVLISPWLSPACRFQPTCSNYSMEAIKAFGIPKGLLLSAKRLSKCHPMGGGGFDPVGGQH